MPDAPRFMLTAPASGSGKTTLTVGLLRALSRRGLTPAACKCGPDYIDPMFHRRVLGVDGYNLDLFFSPPPLVRQLLARAAATAGVTVVEGAMGYYDGIGTTDEASAYAVSRETKTPAILVVPAGGAMMSLAAVVAGFQNFRKDSQIRGVIVNKASARFYEKARTAIENETGLPVFGYLERDDAIQLPSRHLGLMTPDSIGAMSPLLDRLADAVERTIDIDAILDLARTAPALDGTPAWSESAEPLPALSSPVPAGTRRSGPRPVIAVARDEAFSFYYRENLELLEDCGASLVYFSPIRDATVPAEVNGLYLGGGYPEVHARALSENVPMRRSIRDAIRSGLPTVAECGGFLYLHNELEDDGGATWPMVGAIDARGFRTESLRRFGYCTVRAIRDNLLLPAGGELRAHEFHYWDSSAPGDGCLARRPSGETWPCVIATSRLFAGFPHLYLPANPEAAANFVKACL
ncbi:MAG: cobyrinate a,c-diamide synthase [Planctomycetes bacterium]|nr:cobyrinate a,c-diamide synthase [Planctomycetota bacterium]